MFGRVAIATTGHTSRGLCNETSVRERPGDVSGSEECTSRGVGYPPDAHAHDVTRLAHRASSAQIGANRTALIGVIRARARARRSSPSRVPRVPRRRAARGGLGRPVPPGRVSPLRDALCPPYRRPKQWKPARHHARAPRPRGTRAWDTVHRNGRLYPAKLYKQGRRSGSPLSAS